MRPTRIKRVAAGALAIAAGAFGALALPQAANAAGHGTPLPAHVFSPYFEAYTTDSPAALARQSGAKYLTLAFLQTDAAGSCTAYWNGQTTTPVSPATFGPDIAAIRAHGGDVVPSFGGYAADSTGTDIADSCTDVNQIAKQYEKLVTTYNVTRIDLDVEVDALNDQAGVDRRNQAIKKTEDWAAAHGRTVQFVYTLPSTTQGLAPSGLAVLQSAVANHARVDIVNIMTFDYYDGLPHEMATDTETAAAGLHAQLAQLYPHRSSSDLWKTIGVTDMIGVDDFGPPEIFTLADASTVEHWAKQKNIAEISFWALQRDNGNCPGGSAADNCSGLQQTQWQFSHIFEPFTTRGGPWH